jgi:hypothetical protein
LHRPTKEAKGLWDIPFPNTQEDPQQRHLKVRARTVAPVADKVRPSQLLGTQELEAQLKAQHGLANPDESQPLFPDAPTQQPPAVASSPGWKRVERRHGDAQQRDRDGAALPNSWDA